MKRILLAAAVWLAASLVAFGQCDLELTATVSNPTPAQWTNVDYVLTLRNRGPQAATNIIVNCPEGVTLSQSYGLVYTNAVATRGSWNIFTQAWTVPTLAANETVTLTLTLFTMQHTLPAFFAEILQASPNDVDSTPNNNNSNTPVEDDEALVGPNATTCDLEIQFVDVECVTHPDQGTFMTYKVMVTTADPTIDFVILGTDASFIGKFTIPANEPFGPAFQGFFTFYPNEFNPDETYWAKPQNNPTCIVQNTLQPLPGCGNPVVPGACLIPYYFPSQVFCKDNNSNFGFLFDFHSYLNFGTSGLSPSDVYTVLMDGAPTGFTAAVGFSAYFGLDDNFPVSTQTHHFQLVRLSDDKCIGEFDLDPSVFCQEPVFNFCGQQAVFPWHEWIKRVHFDGIDKTSGKSQSSNFRSGPFQPGEQAAFVNAGEDVPFDLTVGYSFIGYDEYVRVWLDFDRSGSFDPGEQVFEGIVPAPASGANVESTLNGVIHIPENAQQGLTTMKITMNRGSYASTCGSVPFGEVEYYSVNVVGGSGNPDPCADYSLTMLGTECTDSGTPDQTSDDGYYIRYRLDFPGHEGEEIYPSVYKLDPCCPQNFPPVFVSGFERFGIIGQNARFGPIRIADFPQVFFVAQVTHLGQFTCSNPTTTVNAPAPCSSGQPPTPVPNCSASSDYPWEDWISKVKIGSFEKTSGKSPYSDFTGETITLPKGQTPVTLTTGYSYYTHDEYWRIWIDFDHDGLFETPSEVAFQGSAARPVDGTPTKALNGTLTVPASALSGPTHARVMMRRNAYGAPCGPIPFGEIEDYTVNISSGLLQPGDRKEDEIEKLEIEKLTDLVLFPNPAGEFVQLNLTNFLKKENVEVAFFDHKGLIVKNLNFDRVEEALPRISLADFQNGLYFVRVSTPGERARLAKLAVMRGY